MTTATRARSASSTAPRVELATEADLPAILAIVNEAADRTVANFATEHESLDEWTLAWRETHVFHPWFVARRDFVGGPRVVGFAKGAPYRSRGAYRNTSEVTVYVDHEHHGTGVGRALYAQLMPTLRAQGYVTLLAGITCGQDASERLHASVGFVRCATLHRVGWKFDRYHDVGYWELHLRADDGAPPSVKRVAVVPCGVDGPGARGRHASTSRERLQPRGELLRVLALRLPNDRVGLRCWRDPARL